MTPRRRGEAEAKISGLGLGTMSHGSPDWREPVPDEGALTTRARPDINIGRWHSH